jgi:hypothetical protein
LNAQVALEEQKGRFSPPLGPDLLPGMYSMPILKTAVHHFVW